MSRPQAQSLTACYYNVTPAGASGALGAECATAAMGGFYVNGRQSPVLDGGFQTGPMDGRQVAASGRAAAPRGARSRAASERANRGRGASLCSAAGTNRGRGSICSAQRAQCGSLPDAAVLISGAF
eukprot:1080818-Pyramimonas_sp.AAC.1